MAACEAYLASKGEHEQAMSSRCWQAEALPARATLSVRQLITAAELGNSSSSKAVWGSSGPDTELPDRQCFWSKQQPELSGDCLLHTTSQTGPSSPTLSPRFRSVAPQHVGTPSSMSHHDRGVRLPSPGTSHNVALLSSGMDSRPADATFQGREPALESMLPEGTPLELCNKDQLLGKIHELTTAVEDRDYRIAGYRENRRLLRVDWERRTQHHNAVRIKTAEALSSRKLLALQTASRAKAKEVHKQAKVRLQQVEELTRHNTYLESMAAELAALLQATQVGTHLNPTQLERLAVIGSQHPTLHELRKENHQLREAVVDSRRSEERLGADLQELARICSTLQDQLVVAEAGVGSAQSDLQDENRRLQEQVRQLCVVRTQNERVSRDYHQLLGQLQDMTAVGQPVTGALPPILESGGVEDSTEQASDAAIVAAMQGWLGRNGVEDVFVNEAGTAEDKMEAALACLLGEREQAALDQLEAINSQLRDQLEEQAAELSSVAAESKELQVQNRDLHHRLVDAALPIDEANGGNGQKVVKSKRCGSPPAVLGAHMRSLPNMIPVAFNPGPKSPSRVCLPGLDEAESVETGSSGSPCSSHQASLSLTHGSRISSRPSGSSEDRGHLLVTEPCSAERSPRD